MSRVFKGKTKSSTLDSLPQRVKKTSDTQTQGSNESQSLAGGTSIVLVAATPVKRMSLHRNPSITVEVKHEEDEEDEWDLTSPASALFLNGSNASKSQVLAPATPARKKTR